MKKILVLTILLFLLIPIRFVSADSGLQISPAVNDLILKPGETYVGSFNIKNNNEYNIVLEVSKGLIDSKGQILLDNFPNKSTEWISLDQGRVELNSQRNLSFNYSITIPEATQEGYYHPMFIFKLGSDQNETGTVTSLTQLLPFQLNLYVSESGVYNGNIQINKLSVGSTVLIGTQQKLDFSVINTNESPTKPLIRIQLLSPDNQIIYQTVQNESLTLLSKDQAISGTVDLSNAFTDSSKIGRYTIELFSTDVLNNKNVSRKIAFWYIPQSIFYLVLIIAGLLISLAIFVKFFRRNLSKKKKEEKHTFMYK